RVRVLACQELEEENSEREQIPRDRPARRVGVGRLVAGRPGDRGHGCAGRPRDVEVDEKGAACSLVVYDILRLDVAVDQAPLLEFPERLALSVGQVSPGRGRLELSDPVLIWVERAACV